MTPRRIGCRPFVSLGLRWCALVLALASGAKTAAVLPGEALRFTVRVWQSDDGLPHNSVFAIAQTPDGYLWVGTREGLARFDGVRFTPVSEPGVGELRQGWITALLAARDGSLWIACDSKGVLRWKNGVFTRLSDTNGLPANHPRCLFESSDGAIWIGDEAGLTRWRDGRLRVFRRQDGLGHNTVRAICEDPNGLIRVATSRGLSTIKGDEVVGTMHFSPTAVGDAIKAVCFDRQGNLWVCSNEGVTRIGPDGRVSYGVKEGLPDRIPQAFYEDRAGRMWIGTYNGVACLVNGKVLATPMNAADVGDLVYTVFEDAEESIWVGGRDGLYRITPARFATFGMGEGLAAENVVSMCEDRDGTLFFATWGGGVNFLEGGRTGVVPLTNTFNYDAMLALWPARAGGVWVGTDFDGHVMRLWREDGQWKSVREAAFGVAVRAIYEEPDGTLWVGTREGLSRRQHGTETFYTATNGLAGNDVRVIRRDRRGRLWIGTEGGLSLWQTNGFRNFGVGEGLAHHVVHAVFEDARGVLWFGTKGGLSCWQDGRFASLTSTNGLFNDEVYEIAEDDVGYFWLSCRRGIFRVSRAELDAAIRGETRTVTSTVFGRADGLLSVQCNGVAKPAAWKSRDGRLWFPTIRGAVAVDCSLKTNDRPPPVHIEEVLVDQQRLYRTVFGVPGPARLTVPPGRGELQIHYTALSFRGPEKVRFRYRLEGVDAGWVEAGTSRTAHYNNVAPGRYTFRVLACNNDGVCNETGASLALVFQPHFWQTTLFKVLVLVAVALVPVALYQVRVRRLRAIENLRIQIAADLHDDVGARLTKVAMLTETLERATPPQDERHGLVRHIAQTTREVLRAMDEIVWTINPKNDTVEQLANYLFQYAQDYFQGSGVRCRLDLPADLPPLALSTQERHNLFMAVKEAFTNVLKHARASEVELGLSVNGSHLVLTVTDNGCGFSPDAVRVGANGLANMKRRLERIGGRFTLESQPGRGTRIRMEARVR
jgi:ligand-binding sensor domain-containing protein/two-component sensor histidine kinase